MRARPSAGCWSSTSRRSARSRRCELRRGAALDARTLCGPFRPPKLPRLWEGGTCRCRARRTSRASAGTFGMRPAPRRWSPTAWTALRPVLFWFACSFAVRLCSHPGSPCAFGILILLLNFILPPPWYGRAAGTCVPSGLLWTGWAPTWSPRREDGAKGRAWRDLVGVRRTVRRGCPRDLRQKGLDGRLVLVV